MNDLINNTHWVIRLILVMFFLTTFILLFVKFCLDLAKGSDGVEGTTTKTTITISRPRSIEELERLKNETI